jgi:hypothetical protein
MTTTSTTKPGDPKNDIGWRSFPEFEKILSAETPPVLAMVEKTCRQLNSLIEAGSEEDQSRARAAMTAYGRSLDLLRILTEARDKAGRD